MENLVENDIPEFKKLLEKMLKELSILEENTNTIHQKIDAICGISPIDPKPDEMLDKNGILGSLWEVAFKLNEYNSSLSQSKIQLTILVG